MDIKKAQIINKKIKERQKNNADDCHHPVEKIAQLEKFKEYIKGDILEVFAGKGNLTKYYQQFGKVEAMTKETHGDSFQSIYKLRGDRKKYNLIDIDSYGYPSRFFPVVFEMMKKESYLVITSPIIGVHCINGVTEQNFITFWRSARPSIGDIVGVLTDQALREWRVLQLMDIVKIKRIWRLFFKCLKISAHDLTNTNNTLMKNDKNHEQISF